MARAPSQSTKAGNANKYGDLQQRLIFLLLALLVYRVGALIPVPGINPEAVQEFFRSQSGIFGLMNIFSGGALSRFTIAALGIMPYISASILIQLLTYVLPSMEQLKKEGEAGRRKISQYTRYATLAIVIVQAFFAAVALEATQGVVLNPGMGFRLTVVLTLATGTMFSVWLGEQITERGLGNGISLIIFANIVAGLPSAIAGLLELVSTNAMNPAVAIFIIILVLVVTYGVVFIERGQRKILVNYARRQVGNKVYGGQSTHLPLKLNMASVMPPIFASMIIALPSTILGFMGNSVKARWLSDLAAAFAPGQPVHMILYAVVIIFFSFFYTALAFNSKETADGLKKSGAFIPGIRPGDQTAKYIDKILMRLTLMGSIYLTVLSLLPEFLIAKYNVSFYFGGTSLLIIVVVTMDFMTQVQTYLMSQKYDTLLKKANFKSLGGGNV